MRRSHVTQIPLVLSAFDGIDEADLATTVRVLRTATERLDLLATQGIES